MRTNVLMVAILVMVAVLSGCSYVVPADRAMIQSHSDCAERDLACIDREDGRVVARGTAADIVQVLPGVMASDLKAISDKPGLAPAKYVVIPAEDLQAFNDMFRSSAERARYLVNWSKGKKADASAGASAGAAGQEVSSDGR